MTTDLAPAARPFDTSPAGPPRPGPDRVPIDERVGGFDRKTIWPGVVLLVVWAIWAHGMPWINSQIELDDPIVAGDVINLGIGNGELTFVPAVGWNLDAGLRLTEGAETRVSLPSSSAVSSDVVSYSVAVGNWEGTADELLDRMLDVNESLDNLVGKDEQGRDSIANADGVSGRILYVNGLDEDVLIAAFVFPKVDDTGATSGPAIGVEIEVRGQTSDLEDQIEEIAAMIDSTTYRPVTQEANS
jgi:hypothetical protein